MGKRIVKPILDVKTGKRYPSEAAAGRELAHLIKGDPKNNFVWFELAKRLPGRFRTRNTKGEWVPLDDPSAPVGTLRAGDDAAEGAGTRTRVTTVAIDEEKYARVKALLGTATLRDTVDRAFDDVLVRAAREEEIARLQAMDGLDLDNPKVMDKAWR